MNAAPPSFDSIRLAVFDVDGIFTDGSLWMDPDGRVVQRFHVRDGHGIKLLLTAGIQVAIVSGRESAAVSHRMRELGVAHVLQGVADKGTVLQQLLAKLEILAAHTLFMGDDEPDLPAMQIAGIAVTVPDAHAGALAAANWVTRAPGGGGAVREICDLLIAARIR